MTKGIEFLSFIRLIHPFRCISSEALRTLNVRDVFIESRIQIFHM